MLYTESWMIRERESMYEGYSTVYSIVNAGVDEIRVSFCCACCVI